MALNPQERQPEVESPEAAARRAAEEGHEFEAHRFGAPPELPRKSEHTSSAAADVELEIIDLADKSNRKRFIDAAYPIYEGDPNWIAPLRLHLERFLDPRHNPAFASLEVHAIMAFRKGTCVGRITVQIDKNYNEYHDCKAGFFGFFECVDDKGVAHAMLDHASRWLMDRGMTEMFGPTNFTMNHTAGLLVENFDRPPFVEELYNKAYYQELSTSYGFGKAKDLLVWWIEVANGMDSKNRKRIARIQEKIRKREGISVRHLDLSKTDEEIDILYDLYMRAWQKNWGFAPLPRKEFVWLAQDLKSILIPELVIFVEVAGEVVGFCATIPNVNERLPKDGKLFPFAWTKLLFGGLKKCQEARLYTLGMLPEYRKRGLESIMFHETLVRAQKLGFQRGEIGWTLDDNDLINRAIESMDGYVDRRYRILGLDLS